MRCGLACALYRLSMSCMRLLGLKPLFCALQEVFGRSVTLLWHGGKMYCVDSLCSHMGGPLSEGDIEDMPDGTACIKCPWHSFKVWAALLWLHHSDAF